MDEAQYVSGEPRERRDLSVDDERKQRSNFINGTVQSINRDLNYVTVRDEATGPVVKVDARRMETRRSVNVWQLRPSDRIAISGTWENRDTFQTVRVNF